METTPSLPNFQERAKGIYNQMKGYSALSGSTSPIFENPDFEQLSVSFIELSLRNQYSLGILHGRAEGLELAAERMGKKI